MNNTIEFMNNVTEFNKGSVYYKGLVSAIHKINKNAEILDTINRNDYFYFDTYSWHTSFDFHLFKITAENYIINDQHKKNKYTKNEILEILNYKNQI